MPKAKNDILQGTLALLVLKTLAAQKRMHGYAIALTSEGRKQLAREEDTWTQLTKGVRRVLRHA